MKFGIIMHFDPLKPTTTLKILKSFTDHTMAALAYKKSNKFN